MRTQVFSPDTFTPGFLSISKYTSVSPAINLYGGATNITSLL